MPQIAPIVLTGDSTSITYSPTSVDSKRVFTLTDRSLGQKALDGTLTVQSRDAGNDSQLVSVKLTKPHTVTDSDTGVTSVVEESTVNIQFRHAAIATGIERQLLVQLIANMLDPSQTVMLPVLQGDENFFG